MAIDSSESRTVDDAQLHNRLMDRAPMPRSFDTRWASSLRPVQQSSAQACK